MPRKPTDCPLERERRRKLQREASARYRSRNPELDLSRSREYEKTKRPGYNEANKERIRERRREHRLRNIDSIKEYQKQWRAENKAVKLHHSRLYEARKLGATPKWLSETEHLHIKCIYEVAAMRNRESDDSWHVDHVVPLRGKEVCGLHVPWNLRVIRAEENLKKGNRLESIV